MLHGDLPLLWNPIPLLLEGWGTRRLTVKALYAHTGARRRRGQRRAGKQPSPSDAATHLRNNELRDETPPRPHLPSAPQVLLEEGQRA
jgi:hypothetical protein